MDTTVFEIDEIAYEQCKKESFDRITLTKKIMDLPPGSPSWTKDNYLIEILLNIEH